MMDPSLNWTCGFSPSGFLECLDEATHHGFRLTEDGSGIESMMSSCDEHRPRMESASDFVHAMTSVCGLVGSRFRWPENECYMEWQGEEMREVTNVNACADSSLLNWGAAGAPSA